MRYMSAIIARKLLRRWTFKAWTYMEIKKTYLFQYNIYKIEGGFR